MNAPILLVCGLSREAALVREAGIVAVAGGGSRSGLEAKLAAQDATAFSAVVSFGLAGALAPGLPPGRLVIPETVTADGRQFECAAALTTPWRKAAPDAATGPLLGVDRPILDPTEKARLRQASGAVALDMESHVAAAYAARRGLPFGVLRAISDGAGDVLPPIAGRAMRPDGSVNVIGVLAALARDPGQFGALLRTARDANRAVSTLRRVGSLLGPGLGLHL